MAKKTTKATKKKPLGVEFPNGGSITGVPAKSVGSTKKPELMLVLEEAQEENSTQELKKCLRELVDFSAAPLYHRRAVKYEQAKAKAEALLG